MAVSSLSVGEGRGWKSRRALVLWIFLLPAVLVLVATSLYPLLYALGVSLTRWNLLSLWLPRTWLGLGNYLQVLQDEVFLTSLGNTLLFITASVGLEFLIGFGIALLTSGQSRPMKIVRPILLVPMMLPPVVVGVLWRMLWHTKYGLVNHVIGFFGGSSIPWLASPTYAKIAVVLSDVWEWTPFFVLVLVAALQAVPQEPYEVAQIDGATRWQIFRFVTWPLLRPMVAIAVALRAMDAAKVFDLIYVLTQGGPGLSTEVTTLFIYKQGLKFFEVGYASAGAWVYLAFILAFSWLLLRRRGEGAQG
ncbi:carbohydrate ABC transporter permease [Limnochorda pilosa]|uniref:ABC transporter permease n=1 Tax=Limnochorda pilosa TaxID=1555112 RepID=A0A0K2SMF2_LIMPI|nr:sugar ABC transporter permease [Limnochorda pilosa]BAS28172.1 ABC transporter permease [Limnochorda pilosa]